MSHAPNKIKKIESSQVQGIRMDITKGIDGIKKEGLKSALGFKESESATVDYLRYYKQQIYFIEFSNIEDSVEQIRIDIEKLEELEINKQIDKDTYRRFVKDVWNRQVTEIINKVNGSERIFERLSCRLISKRKSSYSDKQGKKRHIFIVYHNNHQKKNNILFERLRNRLTGTFPHIKVISTNELSSIFFKKC